MICALYFKTEDYSKTWTKISNGFLPCAGPGRPAQTGLFMRNRIRHVHQLRRRRQLETVPIEPVVPITIGFDQENDLIVATQAAHSGCLMT